MTLPANEDLPKSLKLSQLVAGSVMAPCLPPQDRLEHLRKQCGPHVSAAAKDSVEGICSKIYHISLEYVKHIREKHLAILKEHNISGRCR